MRTDKQVRSLNAEEADRSKVVRTHVAASTVRVALALLALAYAVMWIGGIAQHWRGEFVMDDMGMLSALFLALAGSITLLSTRGRVERALLVAVATLGFASEVAGVHTGFPFGAYHYTDALGPKIASVPVVMTFAWMTLAAYVKQLLARFEMHRGVEVLVAALWLTAFDLLIDPLAANQLGYWRWESNGPFYGVPLTNFAGWFFVSLLVFAVLKRRFAPNPTARLVGLSLIIFFSVLALAHGEATVFLIGCALCAADLSTYALNRRTS